MPGAMRDEAAAAALSAARTRTRSAAGRVPDPSHLLAPQQLLTSPQSGLRYRIERLVGSGGFGQVYLAGRVGRSARVPAQLCVKASVRSDAWVREAYFGQLLDGHPRAIAVYDAFPLASADGRIVYCLALEYARHGDLRAYLHRASQGWRARMGRREIAGILLVLRKLHRCQLPHRDLTPMN